MLKRNWLVLAVIVAYAAHSYHTQSAETFTATNIVATSSLHSQGTTTSDGTLAAPNGLNYGPGQTVALVGADDQDVPIPVTTLVNFDTTGGQEVGGLAYSGGNVDGQILFVLATDANMIVALEGEDPGSLAQNRICCPDQNGCGGGVFTGECFIAGGGGAILRYFGSGPTGR
jgi:hypothetical protein